MKVRLIALFSTFLLAVALPLVAAAGPPDADSDSVPDADDNCIFTANSDQNDADSDTRGDVCDNCMNVVNIAMPGYGWNDTHASYPSYQCDDDVAADGLSDGYGNRCDCDFDETGLCDFTDFVDFLGTYGNPGPDQHDIDCNGTVDFTDFVTFLGMYGATPGPSGLACAGTTPCDSEPPEHN